MTDAARRTRGKSARTKKREREEKFFSLVDRTQELIEQTMDEEGCGLKDLKQITGALKDLKELLFEKDERTGENTEQMTIRIEGDVEEKC